MPITLTVGPDRASRGVLFLLRVLQRLNPKAPAVELLVNTAPAAGTTLPSLTVAEGTFTEVNTVVRGLATALKATKALGSDAFEQSAVSAWLSFAATADGNDKALELANAELANVSYAAGTSALTVADVLLLWTLRPRVAALSNEDAIRLMNLSRWFDQVQHEPAVAGVASGPAPVDLSCLQAAADDAFAAAVAAGAPAVVPRAASAGAGAGAGSSAGAGAPSKKPSPEEVAAARAAKKAAKEAKKAKRAAGKEARAAITAKGGGKAAAAAATEGESKGAEAAAGAGGKKQKKQKKKKGGNKGGNAAPAASWLARSEFKVGKIIKCWKHPEAEKLLVEEIECGEGKPRTIVSGLVGHYTPEAMTGRTVVIAANLKPRPFVGIKSNGMVVCAKSADGALVQLLEVPEGATPGERVAYAGHVSEPASTGQMSKKKVLEKHVLPKLAVNDKGVVVYKEDDGTEVEWTVGGGPVKSGGLTGGTVG